MDVQYNLIKGSKAGLVQVQRQVNKNGKMFTQHFWVKPSDVQSTDIVMGQTDPNNQASGTNQSLDPKKTMVDLLSSHGRGALIAHAKKNGVTWAENPHEGINWMRASMAIQKNVSKNPTAWESTKIGSLSNDNSAQRLSQQDAKTTQKTQPSTSKPNEQTAAGSAPENAAQSVSGDAKDKVKELVSSMGKDQLMKTAKENGVTWNENSHAGVNWMRASMAIAKVLTENPDALTQAAQQVKTDTQAAELKATQKRVKQLEDLMAASQNPTAQQVAQQQTQAGILKGLTTGYKSKTEERVFGDALSKASPEAFAHYRTLGMCAGDKESEAYLANLYSKYSVAVNGGVTSSSSSNVDADPLRNRLQGVVNKQVVGVVKSSTSKMRKRMTQFTAQQKLLEPWTDPNTVLTDAQTAAIKAERSGTTAGMVRSRSMTETDCSHAMMKRVLDKFSHSSEYGALATEYKTLLEEFDGLTESNADYQNMTNGFQGYDENRIRATLNSTYETSVKSHCRSEVDSAEKSNEWSKKMLESSQDSLKQMTKEIADGQNDPSSKYYINPSWHPQYQDEQKAKHQGYIDNIKGNIQRYEQVMKSNTQKIQDAEKHLSDALVPGKKEEIIKAAIIRQQMFDPKFTDLNVNLYHHMMIARQIAQQYQITKDFVAEYPVLSKQNLDTLDTGDMDALTNLSMHAGMFKPSLAKKGDSKDVLLQAYQERQAYLDAYGGVNGGTNAAGQYVEDNEVHCKVSKASTAIAQKLTADIARDWDKAAHGKISYRIKGVYEVSGLALEKDFQAIKKQNQGKHSSATGMNKNTSSDLFYHGTGSMATSLILGHSGEFKVVKAKVGRMLGDGIYLADKSSKSAQYISDAGYTRSGATGSLMIVEASLGSTCNRKQRTSWDSNDTVFAGKSDGVLNNEWCVHNPKAVIPRYLVEMEII